VLLEQRTVGRIGERIDDQYVHVDAAGASQFVNGTARSFLLVVVKHNRIHAFVHDERQA
jgi:hypothetical protein